MERVGSMGRGARMRWLGGMHVAVFGHIRYSVGAPTWSPAPIPTSGRYLRF